MSIKSIDRRRVAEGVLFVLCYVGTARIGLLIDPVARLATAVWPPTGIALAALLICGPWMAPLVALAAFLVNLRTGAPLLAACLISAGNMMEAVAGAFLLRWTGGLDRSLSRVGDVLRLVALAALGSTLVSAGIGTFSVWLTHAVPRGGHGDFFRVWWAGDVMGDLIVAPLLLTWSTRPRPRLSVRRIAEAATLLVCLVVLSLIVFQVLFAASLRWEVLRRTYILFPLLIWAALRFSQRGAASATFLVSALAVWATARGLGPFTQETPSHGLLLLHTFMGTVAVTVLILGAALAERDQAIGLRDEFLSIASHELSTPLTALKLRIQGLRYRLKKDLAGTQDLIGGLQNAEQQIDRLSLLLSNLLDVSRISAGRLSLTLEEVDLAALVQEVVARQQVQLEHAQCPVELSLGEGVVGRWDRLRLEQVVTNFLTNAMKYGRGGRITITVAVTAQQATLRVADSGPGIARADQARIFERFERATRDSGTSGLGLGLYIVRQIMAAHGGSVRVESTPGHGAAFIVDLPLGIAS